MAVVPAQSFSGGSSSASVTLLSTTTNGSNADFDVQSISGAYNDLIVVLIYRGSGAFASETARIRFNNDSTSGHYGYVEQIISGTTAPVTTTASDTGIHISNGNGNSNTANYFSQAEILIPGYASTTWEKQLIATMANPFLQSRQVSTGQWFSTAAINRIQVAALNGGGFLTASQMRIYGRL